MNKHTNRTAKPGTLARPSDEDRLSDLVDLESVVIDVRRAAYLMESFVECELKSGLVAADSGFPCLLNRDQMDGVAYITLLRDLSNELHAEFYAPDGTEAS